MSATAKQFRFRPWVNTLDSEAPKVTEAKKEVNKIEYKGYSKVDKKIECKVLTVKTDQVTKDFVARRGKEPKFFGCGTTVDEERMNIGLTIVQRDNIWHPYYEIKLEDEDMGSKFRAAQKEKALKDATGTGAAIQQIEQQIQQLDKEERAKKQEEDDLAAGKVPKKTFDLKALQAKQRAEDAANSDQKVIDPQAIKLTPITNSITEDDIILEMKKFGTILRVRIPQDERGRNRGMAIVAFHDASAASRAIAQGDITIEYSVLSIEPATKAVRPNEVSQQDRNALRNLTRQKN